MAKDASLTLTVYDGANTSVTLTNGSTNYTYAVGDMLLINAYTNDKDEVISGDGQYVEIVSAAESFVGAQTTIHYNANTHTINGTEYNDATSSSAMTLVLARTTILIGGWTSTEMSSEQLQLLTTMPY